MLPMPVLANPDDGRVSPRTPPSRYSENASLNAKREYRSACIGNQAVWGACCPPSSLRTPAKRMSAPSASHDGSDTAPCRKAPSPAMLIVSPLSLRPHDEISPPPAGEKWHWLHLLV